MCSNAHTCAACLKLSCAHSHSSYVLNPRISTQGVLCCLTGSDIYEQQHEPRACRRKAALPAATVCSTLSAPFHSAASPPVVARIHARARSLINFVLPEGEEEEEEEEEEEQQLGGSHCGGVVQTQSAPGNVGMTGAEGPVSTAWMSLLPIVICL